MKKIVLIGMLVLGMCFLTACGEDSVPDKAAVQVIETHENAENAVREHNEQVLELEDSANQIEELDELE